MSGPIVAVRRNVLSAPNPPAGDKGVLNQATLFHEALHGYTGMFDVDLLPALGLAPFGPSAAATYYLEDLVIFPAGTGARSCAN
jgi:hypothetical protein